MAEKNNLNFDRRSVLAASAGFAGAASMGGAFANHAFAQSNLTGEHADEVEWEIMKFETPEEKFRQFIRMAYSLDERPFVWWALITYNYFQPGELPVPIFGKEAMELTLAKEMRPNVWQVQGNNLSFPRDIETGEFITEFKNPVSGEMVPIPDAKVTVDDPGLIITPQGDRPIAKLDSEPQSSRVTFRREGDYVVLHRIRPSPRQFGMVWPKDFIELGTQRVLADDFFNPHIRTLYGTASATFLLPAHQRWIPIDKAPNMAGGYIVVHVSSLKLPSVEHMPREFKQHAKERGYEYVLNIPSERFRPDV